MKDGGVSTRHLEAIAGTRATAVTAAGSAQGDATELTADLSLITTASASQGVRLMAFTVGSVVVVNGTAVSVLVYPATGVKINNATANTAITLYPGLGVEFHAISSTEVLAIYVAIPAGSVVTASLADGAVTTAKIADDQVTYAKIQNISATSRVLGRRTASAGDTEECTLTQVLDFVGSATRGDLLYRAASDWARLAVGTSGQVIRSNGTDPAYATVTTATLIASGAISSAASVDIAVDGQAWDMVEIHLLNIVPATDDVELQMRFSQSASFLSGASDYQWAFTRGGTLVSDAADSEITIADAVGNSTDERLAATICFYRPTDADFIKMAHWEGGYRAQNAAPLDLNGWGELILNDNAIEDVQFLMSSGNIASGYYYAIGHRYQS